MDMCVQWLVLLINYTINYIISISRLHLFDVGILKLLKVYYFQSLSTILDISQKYKFLHESANTSECIVI